MQQTGLALPVGHRAHSHLDGVYLPADRAHLSLSIDTPPHPGRPRSLWLSGRFPAAYCTVIVVCMPAS